jgi:hypothetical protein
MRCYWGVVVGDRGLLFAIDPLPARTGALAARDQRVRAHRSTHVFSRRLLVIYSRVCSRRVLRYIRSRMIRAQLLLPTQPRSAFWPLLVRYPTTFTLRHPRSYTV